MKLYYIIHDCGDGSVNLRFYESKELADWVEENEDIGFGESCGGCIEGDNIIIDSRSPDINTVEGILAEKEAIAQLTNAMEFDCSRLLVEIKELKELKNENTVHERSTEVRKVHKAPKEGSITRAMSKRAVMKTIKSRC